MTAPCVFDGPINGEACSAWVEQLLVPTLRPGDIVVMDNLGSHKGCCIPRMIRAANAKLWFLPAYSPDLNPIEQTFSTIKQAMRAAQQRTVDASCAKQERSFRRSVQLNAKTTSKPQAMFPPRHQTH